MKPTEAQIRIATRLIKRWVPSMQYHKSIYLRRRLTAGSDAIDWTRRAIRITPSGRIIREPLGR